MVPAQILVDRSPSGIDVALCAIDIEVGEAIDTGAGDLRFEIRLGVAWEPIVKIYTA